MPIRGVSKDAMQWSMLKTKGSVFMDDLEMVSKLIAKFGLVHTTMHRGPDDTLVFEPLAGDRYNAVKEVGRVRDQVNLKLAENGSNLLLSGDGGRIFDDSKKGMVLRLYLSNSKVLSPFPNVPH